MTAQGRGDGVKTLSPIARHVTLNYCIGFSDTESRFGGETPARAELQTLVMADVGASKGDPGAWVIPALLRTDRPSSGIS